jgi:hypothetical protein
METCQHQPIEFGENERFGIFLRNTMNSRPNDPAGQARPQSANRSPLHVTFNAQFRLSSPLVKSQTGYAYPATSSISNQVPLAQGYQFRCNHGPDRRQGRRPAAFCLGSQPRRVVVCRLKRLIIGAKHEIFLIVDRGPAQIAKKTRTFVETPKGKLRLLYLPP